MLEYERTSIAINDTQTVPDYLTKWLRTRALTLSPTTTAHYYAYIHKDLIPRLGAIRLKDLTLCRSKSRRH